MSSCGARLGATGRVRESDLGGVKIPAYFRIANVGDGRRFIWLPASIAVPMDCLTGLGWLRDIAGASKVPRVGADCVATPLPDAIDERCGDFVSKFFAVTRADEF